ncbi:HNH endonuclease [Isosphaera pallida ATCC 43644]|jgi:5-methylcytosine-specific restriction endonuclease McrA|uniref:HNH endonuclease n=1 Tax=Isosphaera pallida (strain ATCC 43644 / DSM 9630 / IS1B) TaxID=575540 RepID=E8R4S9_ISOPI|nr:HNH endonuclease [Isosphaera pallida]ADV61675.1 HNH endonuclease [Isosphaera pallida ATCC 43644]
MQGVVLDRPTLVLNRHWQPVNVASVARCLVMVYNESARIVDPDDFRLYTWEDWARLTPRDDEPSIRCVNFRLKVPEVITLTRYDKYRENTVTFSRRNIFKRDHGTCQYCGCKPGSEALTIDHVRPRSQGGVSSWENCVLACVECNSRKANRTPEQAGMVLKRKPFRPNWKPIYAHSGIRIESWSKFISEAYWNVSLDES